MQVYLLILNRLKSLKIDFTYQFLIIKYHIFSQYLPEILNLQMFIILKKKYLQIYDNKSSNAWLILNTVDYKGKRSW